MRIDVKTAEGGQFRNLEVKDRNVYNGAPVFLVDLPMTTAGDVTAPTWVGEAFGDVVKRAS
jgi:hypothetical protein